jgi:RecJ-like exonuclease
MLTDIICAKCNGRGYVSYVGENRSWSEMCGMCNGTGKLGEIDMVTIPKQEYEELLEYKHMYEDLCT